MPMSRAAWVCLACLAAGQAQATPPEGLARARVCADALDLDCAERELATLRAGLAQAAPDDAITILRFSAEVALATRREADASGHLAQLLDRVPDFAPAEGSWPKLWLAVLERVRLQRPDRAAPTLRVSVAEQAVPGRAVPVVAHAQDPSGVAGVAVYIRRTGTEPLRLALTTRDGREWRGNIPAELVTVPAVLYWVEAVDQRGNGPARLGTPEIPRTLPVVPEPVVATPVYQTWWFWTAIGAGVTAITVGAIFLARAVEEPATNPPARESGTVRVEIVWPK